MNPQRHLIPAVLAALTAQPLPGEAAVFEYLPAGSVVPVYVLIAQPTAVALPGSVACRIWSCTLLLDCVTLCEPTSISGVLADELADAVLSRLDGVRLPLAGGLQMGDARLELLSAAEDYDSETIDVHRYVRMRFDLYLNL